MTADRTTRLREIGAVLAERAPSVLDAALLLLESVPGALDAARPARYEILRMIGAGGQAEVLLGALHGLEGFQRPVAVKCVRSDAKDADRSTARLRAEALHTAALFHPNVVSVVDLDRDRAGRLLLVMEYVDGVDLATLAASGPVPYPVVIFIVGELLAGLGYIHDLRDQGRVPGLVHRDVAPDNVLLSREGAVKLTDFGVARALIGDMTAASLIPDGKAATCRRSRPAATSSTAGPIYTPSGSCSGSSWRSGGFASARPSGSGSGPPSVPPRARARSGRGCQRISRRSR